MQKFLVSAIAGKKYLIGAVGVAAFIFGGFVTRAKTLDGIEVLEKRYFPPKEEQQPTPSTPPPAEQ